MDFDGNLLPDSKFDPTTPVGAWDSVAKEYENTTEKVSYNYHNLTIQHALFHHGWNASPTPISGDQLARYKASCSA